MSEALELMLLFPKLAPPSKFTITSPKDKRYNCIAWAAGETHRRWWPDQMGVDHWPDGAPRESSLEAFLTAFGTLGYQLCESLDLEAGFEKIAIFTWAAGTPKHAARQLPDGAWTSKLGHEQDISHDLKAVEGRDYGSVLKVMRRRMAPPSAS